VTASWIVWSLQSISTGNCSTGCIWNRTLWWQFFLWGGSPWTFLVHVHPTL